MKHLKILIALALALTLLAALVLSAAAEDIVPPGQNKGEGEDQTPAIGGDDRGDADQRGDDGSFGYDKEPPEETSGQSGGSGAVVEDDVGDNTVIIVPPEQDDDDGGTEEPEDDWDYGSSQIILEGGTVYVTDSMSFDPQTRLYVYPIGNSGNVVKASVAHGMVVTGSVRVEGATLLIYKDSKLWNGDASNITEPGEYVVMAQTGNQTPRLFTFTLVGKASSTIYAYTVPTGMIVTNATRDGEEIDYDRSTVPMQEDGLYHVEYESLSTGASYVLDITIDRTPPELRFSGSIDENNRVHSPLAFSGLQSGDTIQATLDGTAVDVSVHADGTGEFTDNGSYIITVYDEAGNSTTYGYIIMLYFNASSIAFFAVLLAAVAAVVIYIVIKRKRLEIG